MRSQLPVLTGVVLLACLVVSALPKGAVAATHVLLVGVSTYPALPKERHLRGPLNDVQIMYRALTKFGVPASGITVLADGVRQSRALPTRRNILDAFDALAAQAKPGDWVVIYLSGHGSQQPQIGRDAYIEPDGLDEVFLPYDVGFWDGTKKSVARAILDDEIGAALSKINRTGAHLWAIFDTCFAGGMARQFTPSNQGAISRFIFPSLLGVPDNLFHSSRRSKRESAGTATPIPQPGEGFGFPAKDTVLFFASHPDEPAAEEPLPDLLSPTNGTRYHGLFTYLIAQAMPGWHGDFNDLAEYVSDRYRSRPYPTPLFQGDLKSIPNFFETVITNALPPRLNK